MDDLPIPTVPIRPNPFVQRFARGFAVIAATTAIALSPAALHAQLPDGRFVRDAAAGDDLEHVVTEALPHVKSTLAKIFKGKAKSRLRQVVVAAAWEQFTPVGDAIRLETDAWSGDRGITAKPGSVIKGWKRYWPNGKTETLDVQLSRQGNALVYRYLAEDGQRTDEYTLDATGSILTQNITLESGQLSSPIHYRLVYRKVRSGP